ncbi:MAG: hypothetical protein WAX04_10955 [Oscillospiraceae bacterium]
MKSIEEICIKNTPLHDLKTKSQLQNALFDLSMFVNAYQNGCSSVSSDEEMINQVGEIFETLATTTFFTKTSDEENIFNFFIEREGDLDGEQLILVLSHFFDEDEHLALFFTLADKKCGGHICISSDNILDVMQNVDESIKRGSKFVVDLNYWKENNLKKRNLK